MVAKGIHFLQWAHIWPVLLGSIVLIGIFVAKEWLHNRKKWLPLRLGAVLLGVFALAMILLQPAVAVEKSSGVGAVLTQNYRQETLDSLEKLHPGLAVFQYGKETDLAAFTDFLGSIYILGEGVPYFDNWAFKGKNTTFLPSKLPSGVMRLTHPKRMILGEQMIVRGVFHNPLPGHQLLLRDPGGNTMDSLILENSELETFQFTATPKAAGTFVYSLVEKDSTAAVVRQDPLPIQVAGTKPLSILLLQTYPSFEGKYLKNYLAEKGHALVVRSQLTKDRFKFEYVNTRPKPLYSLSLDVLERFDLVLLDAETYASLGKASTNRVLEGVKEQGLGLFVIPTENNWGNGPTSLEVLLDNKRQVKVSDDKGTLLPKFPYVFKKEFPVASITFQNAEIGAFRPYGNGRLGSTVLHNTHGLLLKGEKELYGKLWSQMLNAVAKRGALEEALEVLTPLPKAHEPVALRLRSTADAPMLQDGENTPIPLMQEMLLPYLWGGTHYPKSGGWQTLITLHDSIPFYVYAKEDWPIRSAFDTRGHNLRHFTGKDTAANVEAEWQRIDPLWWYALLLLAWGGLWLWPKLV